MKALEKARQKNLEKIKLSELKAEKDKKDSELNDRFKCSNVSIDLEKCDDQLDIRKAKPMELKNRILFWTMLHMKTQTKWIY